MPASTSTPPVPPRPVRVQAAAAAGADKLPTVPPRPLNKRIDRSVSPGNYPPSPLYDAPAGSSLYRPKTNEASLAPLARTPSVQNLPSVGQEGNEYADIHYQPSVSSSGLATDAAAQTRSIGEDLKLHAPKPSLPTSSAKAQVQAVTRTDRDQAASPGFGKPGTPNHDDFEPLHKIRSRASFSRPGSTASAERRTSVYAEEQGPAETGGIRVPINPLLGDVQAPSPAPFGSALTPTHTGGQKQRPHHFRTKSGREGILPPGSYGLHGHGVVPNDRFEQDWYQKHPDQLANEEQYGHGVYESIGSGRGNFALSSDDLNKIVRNTASRGSGFGTNPKTMSYPDEQIGYMASEQYSTAAPNYLSKMHSNSSQPHVESPLRKASLPTDDQGREEFKASKKSSSLHSKSGDDAIEEDDNIHVTPGRHYNKVTGGEETMHETEEARPYIRERASNGGLADEHGYSVPILAEDEVARGGSSEFMQPAISPKQDRRGSAYDLDYRSGDHTPSSRPASRPGSVYGLQGVNHSLSRFSTHHDERESMHTPLEDVAEYEPLFPDDDGQKRPISHAERFKQRPDMWKHRFPSQDIWEDTPDSSMYVTTVSTPELPPQQEELKQLGQSKSESETKPEAGFEHPDVEAARKGEPSEAEKRKLIPAEERLAKSRFAPHLRDDMPTRPGMKPRFPSQDIWEDSPDSQQLVTTVSGPQSEEQTRDETSPVEMKPSVPPRPAKHRLDEAGPSAQAAPSIPARPAKYSVPPPDAKLSDLSIPANQPTSKEASPTERKGPVVPDRPKPQVPARPTKKTSSDSLSKSLSATSAGSAETLKSPPQTKAKPVVPARPGNKIQSLKGNFMNDLNQKLGLGPPKEKQPEPEVEQEVKPLEDARKGRARGPQRRAPAKSPSLREAAATKAPVLGLFAAQTHWHIDPKDGMLNAHLHGDNAAETGPAPAAAAEPSEESSEETPVPQLSAEKVEQLDHATISDAPPPPTIDTTLASSDAPEATSIAEHKADELADPGPPEPTREISDPIAKAVSPIDGGDLSHNTTESSEYSGHTLTREEPDPNTDAIPLSKHTTAGTEGSGATLEQVETHDPTQNRKAEEEPVSLRDEQVSAPAPAADQNKYMDTFAQNEDASQLLTNEDGAAEPKEPMQETDFSYKILEEMTAKADGKGHAKEEESVKH